MVTSVAVIFVVM